MATLKEIRRAVGHLVNGDAWVTGTATAADDTGLTDMANLLDLSDDTQHFAGAWLYMATGEQTGTVRRITAYAPTTGTLTVNAWTSPAEGDEYEIHGKLRPSEMNYLINEALIKLPYHDEQAISVVAGQRQYDLSAYAWLVEPQQVYAVCAEKGNAGEYTYPEVSFEVTNDAGALTLHVDPYEIKDCDNVILRCVRTYEALANDATATACELEWIVGAAAYLIYTWLTRNGPAQDVTRYKQQAAEEGAGLIALNRRYFTPPARRQRSPYAIGRG